MWSCFWKEGWMNLWSEERWLFSLHCTTTTTTNSFSRLSGLNLSIIQGSNLQPCTTWKESNHAKERRAVPGGGGGGGGGGGVRQNGSYKEYIFWKPWPKLSVIFATHCSGVYVKCIMRGSPIPATGHLIFIGTTSILVHTFPQSEL